jgi:hypothetical protein
MSRPSANFSQVHLVFPRLRCWVGSAFQGRRRASARRRDRGFNDLREPSHFGLPRSAGPKPGGSLERLTPLSWKTKWHWVVKWL